MKGISLFMWIFLISVLVNAQTLQTITDNGNITSRSISVGLGYNDAKLNVNAVGVDQNGSNDMTILVTNHRYNSTNATGDNRIVFGWGNHWAAAIGAYKQAVNTTGLKFFTEIDYNLPIERMRISAEGNVGIGTTDPKGYKLTVNGKIRTQEIKVENSNWPDYVFFKSYKLPSLEETENHIKEKGHLPGIPSAIEVKENGIDLGEMNAKLLQKIEELTLHLIDMKKEIKELKHKQKR